MGLQAITVHAASFAPLGGSVFYACLPGAGSICTGRRAIRTADKTKMTAILWDHVVAREQPLRQNQHGCTRAEFPLLVGKDPLGRPHLLVGDVPGPSISFSESGGNIWAALCGNASDIGIDVATADEFQGAYPVRRVFHDQELHHALKLTKGDVAEALALVWSVKEAVVKALGCAFHLVAPREVHIAPSIGEGSGPVFPVYLSGKALIRYPLGVVGSIWVRSFFRDTMWLSIALLGSQSPCGYGEDFSD